jgi:hypothetical protein
LRRNFCFMLFHRALYKVDPAVREWVTNMLTCKTGQ